MTAEHPQADLIQAALQTVNDPEIGRPITDLGMVDTVTFSDTDPGAVTVRLLLTTASCPLKTRLTSDITTAVAAVHGVTSVSVDLGVMDADQLASLRSQLRGGVPERVIPFAQPGNLTRVIAIASGKGGVGKSSVTVNLAMALVARGRSVGVLDADIYGHSIPDMLGVGEARPTQVDDMIMPVPTLGLKVISIGMMKESRDQVVAWRGPMLDKALTQLLTDVYWGDVDYLLLDLPPGTGDIMLGLGQKLPNCDVIVVTTPQLAATEVAERAGVMAGLMNQRVIGVIENMSWLETDCPNCDQPHRIDLFGTGGGETTAQVLSDRLGYDVPLLAHVPLDPALRVGGDEGAPLTASDPSRPAAQALAGVAEILDSKPRGLAGVRLDVSPT